jgi:hypothetical protein
MRCNHSTTSLPHNSSLLLQTVHNYFRGKKKRINYHIKDISKED